MLDAVLCDDQRLFGESFAVALRDRGVRVVVTCDPEETLAALGKATVDRVVMNVRLPHGRGLEAARLIRARWPETAVLCLDADTQDLRLAAADAGARAVLSKSQPLKELVDTVLAPSWLPVPVTDRRSSDGTQESNGDGARPGEPLAAKFLTRRERDVLRLLVGGRSTLAIARDLGISVATTRGYIQSMLLKLGVHSRVEAVAYAVHQAVLLQS